MKTILIGNADPLHRVGGAAVRAPHLDQTVTRIEPWDGIDNPEFVALATSTRNDRVLSMIHDRLGEHLKPAAVVVAEVEQLWPLHSAGSPAWVSCPDDPTIEEALAAHFGAPRGEQTMLLTNGGRDALHAQHLSGSQPAAFSYMALTANSSAANAADTTLTGEIATASGGLVRASATYAHTAGTNTSTLTKTFTANGSDSLPVTVAKIGIFNAASSGTMAYETLLAATVTLNVSGDNTTITWTDTVG